VSASGNNPEQKRRVPPKAWKPGQSGNPSGRPKVYKDIQELAKVHTPAAIAALVLSLQDERTRVPAAVALLDRGWGKPSQSLDINSNSTIELHLVAARAISATLIEQQSTPAIETIESTSTDIPTE
jgi:HEAT repeat protein